MKRLLKLIYKLLQRLISLTGWTFIVTRSRLRRNWVTSYISSADVLMRLDLSESLDVSYASGSVDELNIAFMKQTLNNHSVFIDVGANQGFYSLYVLKKFPGAQVVAIEPDPYSLSKLRNNLDLNSLQNGNLITIFAQDELIGISGNVIDLNDFKESNIFKLYANSKY